MKKRLFVARDIRGSGLLFAAGIATGLVLASKMVSTSQLPVLALCSVTASGAFLFLRGEKIPARMAALLTGAAFFFCGLFCSLNSSPLTLSLGDTAEGLPRKAVEALRREIDSIGFPSASSGALVKALLTGDKSGLPPGIIEVFRESGASHILALSGLHLGIIYLIISKITKPIGNSVIAVAARFTITVGAALFYTVMTGASPSIVRAFLFIALGETAKILHRSVSPARTLFCALTLQLAMKPSSMMTVGFQLSYLAMVGIFFLFPFLSDIYPRAGNPRLDSFNLPRKIWDAASLSISCQALTGPLAWHYFHSFPKYFILTNLVALPLTSVTMALSVATITLSFMGICPHVMILLDDKALQALVFCLEVISGM